MLRGDGSLRGGECGTLCKRVRLIARFARAVRGVATTVGTDTTVMAVERASVDMMTSTST